MDKIEKMFLDLNSVLVKFWIEQGRPDKETKIALLERMLNWYKKMGYVTPQSLSEEPDKSLEEAAMNYIAPIENEDGLKVINFSGQDIKDAFIAGAKWQAEQDDRDVVFWKGMQHAYDKLKEYTVEGIYTKSMDGKNVFVESGALKIDPESVKVGDPVKLIIIKDNESD